MFVSDKGNAPAVLDFSAFYGTDVEAKKKLFHDIKLACRDNGFFQLVNHGVSPELQQRIQQACKDFFSLPMEEKMKCSMHLSKHNHGYDSFGAQQLESGTLPEAKEGLYIGEHVEPDDPKVLRGDYNCGPNLYPEILGKPFQDTCTEYYNAVRDLGKDIMRAIAPGLGLPESWFDSFTEITSATLRMIHYTPIPKDDPRARSIGAHRDYGCITILLQDQVGGLQVQDEMTGEWIDVKPVPNAFVINLGNLMMRWTNHHYTSNTHRVVNYSDNHRYSVPFFFNGNSLHTLNTIPGCEVRRDTSMKKYGPPQVTEPYEPVLVKDFMLEQFSEPYQRALREQKSQEAPLGQEKEAQAVPLQA